MLAICLGLLIGSGGSVWADKPRIAVLGLEAAPAAGGLIDPAAQLVAKEITRELRQRVQTPACPYVMAPNSSQELLDEKILMSCDTEAADCMVVIGAGLASDVVLYGRVDRRGESFRVSLKLLDVKRRTVQPAIDEVPVGAAVSGVSRRLYNKLIGDGPRSDGTLLVRARSDTGAAVRGGMVKVDDEPRGQLTGGKLIVTEVIDGQHSVAIEVPGHRRFEEIVMVHGGTQATIDALLHATEPAPPERPERPERPDAPVAPGRPSPLWKLAAGAGVAIALGGGGFAFYSYDREVNHNSPRFQVAIDPLTGKQYQKFSAPDSSDCGKTSDKITGERHTVFPGENRGIFDRACTWHTRTYLGIGVAAVGGLVAIGSLIMMSRDPGPPDRPVTGARARQSERARRSELGIIPIVTPELAGAQLSLDW
ncbi:MAG TPA: hypothetical protein VGD37_11595 [Kofleriaceae bacterium]